MKHTVLAALFLQTVAISAQTDTLPAPEIRTEEGLLERQRIVNRYDEVFGIHEPARWLFKWDVASTVGISPQEGGFANEGLRFDAEWKPGQAFSLNASYMLGVDFSLDGLDLRNHGFRLEPRWYFGMRKRVREGRGASNFSGNYLGLELAHIIKVGNLESSEPRLIYRGAMARFGVQRRLFNYGFFDFSYGIGIRNYEKTSFSRGGTQLFSEARAAIGLALAQPKAKAGMHAGYCEVLQCFREERRMFKADLFNLFHLITADYLAGTARIALEQKIGHSPFSIELEGSLNGKYGNFKYSQNTISQEMRGYGYGIQLQTRYYYSQKRRIAMGKSGNHLSGAYLAWATNWSWSHATVRTVDATGASTITGENAHLKTGLVWGIQYRMFKNGFIDFNLGAGWGEEYNGKDSSTDNNYNSFQILGGLRIGLAF